MRGENYLEEKMFLTKENVLDVSSVVLPLSLVLVVSLLLVLPRISLKVEKLFQHGSDEPLGRKRTAWTGKGVRALSRLFTS